MFASRVKKNITIERPEEEGGPVSVVIRKLSFRSLEKASDARQAALGKTMRNIGADNIKALGVGEDARPEKPKVFDPVAIHKARLNSYDKETVVLAGVESWSDPKPISEVIGDLDEPTVTFLFEEIMSISLGPISEEEWKASQGKG